MTSLKQQGRCKVNLSRVDGHRGTSLTCYAASFQTGSDHRRTSCSVNSGFDLFYTEKLCSLCNCQSGRRTQCTFRRCKKKHVKFHQKSQRNREIMKNCSLF
ncbi:hypothetical protein NQD34_018484 [Periophthalmus magnuspinnatus]|nr:hypothetical protein NQD34_018484 [Periophthalmus magnuspinnatus]